MKLATLVLLTSLLLSNAALARVTKVVITKKESPTFQGTSFSSVGTYEKIVGRYFGELDPSDPALQKITDIHLAQKNSNGKIEYSADFYILKPLDLSKGSDAIFYEFNNRGSKLAMYQFNESPSTQNPTTAADAGNGFLMRHGLSVVWSGYLGDVEQGFNSLAIRLPIAVNPDGSDIEGKVWHECFNDFWKVGGDEYECQLAYPVASPNQSEVSLLTRDRRQDIPTEILSNQWRFISNYSLGLLPPFSTFKAEKIYQAIYTARRPPVMGIGLVAVRDWISFLKFQEKDDLGTPNPLYKHVKVAYSTGLSQAGRASRDFVHLGLNQAETGGKVFDGMLVLVAAGRTFLNFRFAQPTRIPDFKHEGLYYPNYQFPFAYENQVEPFTQKSDGILDLCTKTSTCPKILHQTSAPEYWQLRGSLVTTDPLATLDGTVPDNVRIYHMASMGHFPKPYDMKTACQQPSADLSFFPVTRALLVSLEKWVNNVELPPESQYPKLSDQTLVEASQLTWPAIQGVPHPGSLLNPHRSFDYGPSIDQGIISVVPPVEKPNESYKVLVPKVDADGNEIAGVRMPAIRVPLATYAGWNIRASGVAKGEICGLMGSTIPFENNATERVARGDARASRAERYADLNAYQKKLEAETDKMIGEKLLLSEDRALVIKEALKKWK